MMVFVRIPIIAKTNTKPSERVNETFNPLRIPTSRSSLLSDSRPKKYDFLDPGCYNAQDSRA